MASVRSEPRIGSKSRGDVRRHYTQVSAAGFVRKFHGIGFRAIRGLLIDCASTAARRASVSAVASFTDSLHRIQLAVAKSERSPS